MPSIDWSSAEVEDGTLTVRLSEKRDDTWRERVSAVVERLGHDGVKVGKDDIRVQGVQPGGEGDIRHLLESAVLQANTDLGSDDDESESDEKSETDRKMTQAFRAFASRD